MAEVGIRAGAALAALSAAILATAAPAQLAPGRSGGPDIIYLDAEQSMKELAIFGRCFASTQRKQGLSLIATRPGSREEAEFFRKFFKDENQICLIPGTTLYSLTDSFRGAIAEGLLRSDEPLPAELRLAAPAAAEVRSLSDAARCYAGSHRAETQAVLATKAGSRAEFEAVKAVLPGFGACLPAGGKVRATATLIRFRLAEALLRLGIPFLARPGS